MSSVLRFSNIQLFLTGSYVYCISRTFLLKKNKELRLEKNSILGSILSAEEFSENVSSNTKGLREKLQKSFDILRSDILESSSALFINESRIPFITDVILTYCLESKTQNPNTFKNLNIIFDRENIAYLERENSWDFALCLKVVSEHSGDGLLFLGQKVGGGLYAEEEIETAKAAVSWMLFSLFMESNSMVLSFLQRKHMEEQRISDYKTRQILHDEVLPEIHSSILILSQIKNESASLEQIQLLTNLHKRVSSFLRELPDTSLEIARLGLIDALMRLIGSEFEISWFH
ncbi:hypothetical protein LEP1GSC188_0640 [Leptospira weilii serovar Topaz str. LT2116]|uniref:Uncharacterized protein n=1 Tax=Leptospira weilii serovar Topaz str. LT2116 TaxID=1088540 RepID=M3H041_9LEPT|nr:hypothetical protein LEP1GSC188_0640 [Leptospira weilii serovar Topaz str. LT2116]